jgi:hypothetical protein
MRAPRLLIIPQTGRRINSGPQPVRFHNHDANSSMPKHMLYLICISSFDITASVQLMAAPSRSFVRAKLRVHLLLRQNCVCLGWLIAYLFRGDELKGSECGL